MTDNDQIKCAIDNLNGDIDRACRVSGRQRQDIKVVAAVKQQPIEIINLLSSYGIGAIGENRADELRAKFEAYDKALEVHFIGQLQSNKVKYVIDKVSLIHSLDRVQLAVEIDKRAKNLGIVMPVLVQVNMDGEITKGGVAPHEVHEFVCEIAQGYPNILVQGLMSVMPINASRQKYLQLSEIYDILRQSKINNTGIKYLSMGMSNDYVTAIECGANLIRPGRVIFGERNKV